MAIGKVRTPIRAFPIPTRICFANPARAFASVENAQAGGVQSQRMCPSCGLITSRQTRCLEIVGRLLGVIMSKLSVHGKPVADYVRRSTTSGEFDEVTYRLMSDGVLLKQTTWTRYGEGRAKRPTSRGPWKIAKVTPRIKANPDLLLSDGFQKKLYPTSV